MKTKKLNRYELAEMTIAKTPFVKMRIADTVSTSLMIAKHEIDWIVAEMTGEDTVEVIEYSNHFVIQEYKK